MSTTRLALKSFMKSKFDFRSMKKAGIFPKEMKHTDYEGQAEAICRFLGLKSIYEYGKNEIRCHITYAEGVRKEAVNKDGKLVLDPPFVEVFFPNSLHI